MLRRFRILFAYATALAWLAAAAPSFTALERALFEMLSAALRDKLAP